MVLITNCLLSWGVSSSVLVLSNTFIIREQRYEEYLKRQKEIYNVDNLWITKFGNIRKKSDLCIVILIVGVVTGGVDPEGIIGRLLNPQILWV